MDEILNTLIKKLLLSKKDIEGEINYHERMRKHAEKELIEITTIINTVQAIKDERK